MLSYARSLLSAFWTQNIRSLYFQSGLDKLCCSIMILFLKLCLCATSKVSWCCKSTAGHQRCIKPWSSAVFSMRFNHWKRYMNLSQPKTQAPYQVLKSWKLGAGPGFWYPAQLRWANRFFTQAYGCLKLSFFLWVNYCLLPKVLCKKQVTVDILYVESSCILQLSYDYSKPENVHIVALKKSISLKNRVPTKETYI